MAKNNKSEYDSVAYGICYTIDKEADSIEWDGEFTAGDISHKGIRVTYLNSILVCTCNDYDSENDANLFCEAYDFQTIYDLLNYGDEGATFVKMSKIRYDLFVSRFKNDMGTQFGDDIIYNGNYKFINNEKRDEDCFFYYWGNLFAFPMFAETIKELQNLEKILSENELDLNRMIRGE